MAPITLFFREEALWMDLCLSQRQIPETCLTACLSELAGRVRSVLSSSGAMFAGDLVRMLGAAAEDVNLALWELVAAGLVTADGFDSLRMLIDPRRKQAYAAPTGMKSKSMGRAKQAAGRWSMFSWRPFDAPSESTGQAAERREAELESACWMLLRRYGVVFRDVLARETAAPRWRDLLGLLRRMEARGEVRGGRFVSGFSGEQFALPEALESLREVRRSGMKLETVTVAGADPMNLLGILIPGERVAAVPGNRVTFDESVLTPLEARNLPPFVPNLPGWKAVISSLPLPLTESSYDHGPAI
jgi:ATP-dependent Lhr-like helicase